jgi:hypothetical protein
MARPLQRTSPSGFKSWGTEEEWTLAHVRQIIHDAAPDIEEEWKWRGTPVWSHDGIVCTGESYKQVVKLTFAGGASIKDSKKLFNSSLEGNTRRAIDLREGEKINEGAFRQLVRAAVAANSAARAQRQPRRSNISPALWGTTCERRFATEGELWDAGRSRRIPIATSSRWSNV